MKKVYLIVLEGQGDTEIKVVDEETWKWVMSDDMGMGPRDGGKTSWHDRIIPASQVSKIKRETGESPWEITIGSWQNDRALMAVAADGYTLMYDSFKEAVKEIKYKGDDFVDEYHGVIY